MWKDAGIRYSEWLLLCGCVSYGRREYLMRLMIITWKGCGCTGGVCVRRMWLCIFKLCRNKIMRRLLGMMGMKYSTYSCRRYMGGVFVVNNCGGKI